MLCPSSIVSMLSWSTPKLVFMTTSAVISDSLLLLITAEGAGEGLSMLDRFASEERDGELQAAIEAALEALTVVLNLVD